MTNDHENEIVLGIVCKWRTIGELTVHTFSTIINYKYHDDLDLQNINININPMAILKSHFGDRIDLTNIEILDKVYYFCDIIEFKLEDGEERQHYHSITSDASFVMPYDD